MFTIAHKKKNICASDNMIIRMTITSAHAINVFVFDTHTIHKYNNIYHVLFLIFKKNKNFCRRNDSEIK